MHMLTVYIPHVRLFFQFTSVTRKNILCSEGWNSAQMFVQFVQHFGGHHKWQWNPKAFIWDQLRALCPVAMAGHVCAQPCAKLIATVSCEITLPHRGTKSDNHWTKRDYLPLPYKMNMRCSSRSLYISEALRSLAILVSDECKYVLGAWLECYTNTKYLALFIVAWTAEVNVQVESNELGNTGATSSCSNTAQRPHGIKLCEAISRGTHVTVAEVWRKPWASERMVLWTKRNRQTRLLPCICTIFTYICSVKILTYRLAQLAVLILCHLGVHFLRTCFSRRPHPVFLFSDFS